MRVPDIVTPFGVSGYGKGGGKRCGRARIRKISVDLGGNRPQSDTTSSVAIGAERKKTGKVAACGNLLRLSVERVGVLG
jgi:hypothetical protein